jgi:arylsulfatase A-like enzyme
MAKGILSGAVAFAALGVCFSSCEKAVTGTAQPNIIFIMSDDAGYSDIGCFGSEIKTPNLDRLGYGGVRFTSFYSGSKCEPSRSSLFTGHYEGGARSLNFVRLLKEHGYHTIHSGKEHFMDWVPKEMYASEVNDQSLTFWGMNEFFEPPSGKWARPFILNGQEVGVDQIYHEKKPFFKTDAITDNALRWMEEPINRGQPFFLFLGYGAPHYPLQARPEDIEKYRGEYLKGWDSIRSERYKRMKELGLIPDWTALSPPSSNINRFRGSSKGEFEEKRALIPLYRPWEELTEAEKDEMDLEMAVFAAMVDRMDQNIGRILDKLEEAGISDNTIIMYVSDNGSCPYDSNRDFDYPPGDPAGFRTLSAAWANAGNTPFRFFKQYGHEGGARTHCLVSWPERIQPGILSHDPLHMVDFFPTILEVAGIEYPSEMEGMQPQPLHGHSIVPMLEGKTRETPPYFISGWTERFRMYREGNWKIVKKNGEGWELYNVNDDPTEILDLSEAQPQLVEQMQNRYEAVRDGFKAEQE